MAQTTHTSGSIATEWLGLKQVSRYASVCERTVRSWIHSRVDSLPAVRISGKILIKRTDLDAWLERRRIKGFVRLDLDVIVGEILRSQNGRIEKH